MLKFFAGFGIYLIVGAILEFALVELEMWIDKKIPGIFDADTPSKQFGDNMEKTAKIKGLKLDDNNTAYLIMIVAIILWPLNIPMCICQVAMTCIEYFKMRKNRD